MYTIASRSIFSCMFLFLVSFNAAKQMCNSSYCLKLSYQLSYFLWYIVLTAFLFATWFPSCTFGYHIFKKNSEIFCVIHLEFLCNFFMFKARGSSMKRGSFNKKRSVKRKSTKVCVVIISEGPFVVCFTIITLSLIIATLPYDDVWTFDNHWCINQVRLLQSVTVPLRTILMSR